MRILAIDYGRKRVGVAISDQLGITAQPLPAITFESLEKLINALTKIIAEKEVEKIIVGLPLQLDGTEGIAAKEVRKFVATLSKEILIPFQFIDERLTTSLANRLLTTSGQHGKRKKTRIDTVAAQAILQTYLEMKKNST